jgi:hypothetical protein
MILVISFIKIFFLFLYLITIYYKKYADEYLLKEY